VLSLKEEPLVLQHDVGLRMEMNCHRFPVWPISTYLSWRSASSSGVKGVKQTVGER
jgi:hypothetical protein